MALPIRQGATHKVVMGPAVAVGDGFTPVTTLALSTADEAEVILHDNGTVVSISAYTWAAITTADGYYHLTLQSGISGTVGHMTVVVNDDSLCLPLRADFIVMTPAAYDARYGTIADAASELMAITTITGLNSQSDFDITSGVTDDNQFNGCLAVITDVTTAAQKTIVRIATSTASTNNLTLDSATPVSFTIADGDYIAIFRDSGFDASSKGEIADAVWDEALSGHVTAGTSGERIGRVPNAAAGGAGGLPTVDANNYVAGFPGAKNVLDDLVDHDGANTTLATGAITSDIIGTDAIDADALSDDAVAEIADAVWDELMAGHVTADSAGLVVNELQDAGRLDALIDAIKAVTDQFVFTKANEVDANTKSINDAAVVGDGNATPWDGA